MAAANDGPQGVQGLSLTGNGQCIYDFSSFFNLVLEETQTKLHLDAAFDVTDKVEAYGSVSFADGYATRGNSLFPDVSFAIIPADHFGLQLDAARRGIAPVPYLALQRTLGGHYESSFEERPLDTNSTYERTNYRFNGGVKWDFELGDKDWNMDALITYSERTVVANTPGDTLTNNTDAAYVGLGGPNCNSIDTADAGSGNLGTGDCFY